MAQKPWIELDTPGQLTENPWQLKPDGQVGSVKELVVKVPNDQGSAPASPADKNRPLKFTMNCRQIVRAIAEVNLFQALGFYEHRVFSLRVQVSIGHTE